MTEDEKVPKGSESEIPAEIEKIRTILPGTLGYPDPGAFGLGWINSDSEMEWQYFGGDAAVRGETTKFANFSKDFDGALWKLSLDAFQKSQGSDQHCIFAPPVVTGGQQSVGVGLPEGGECWIRKREDLGKWQDLKRKSKTDIRLRGQIAEAERLREKIWTGKGLVFVPVIQMRNQTPCLGGAIIIAVLKGIWERIPILQIHATGLLEPRRNVFGIGPDTRVENAVKLLRPLVYHHRKNPKGTEPLFSKSGQENWDQCPDGHGHSCWNCFDKAKVPLRAFGVDATNSADRSLLKALYFTRYSGDIGDFSQPGNYLASVGGVARFLEALGVQIALVPRVDKEKLISLPVNPGLVSLICIGELYRALNDKPYFVRRVSLLLEGDIDGFRFELSHESRVLQEKWLMATLNRRALGGATSALLHAVYCDLPDFFLRFQDDPGARENPDLKNILGARPRPMLTPEFGERSLTLWWTHNRIAQPAKTSDADSSSPRSVRASSPTRGRYALFFSNRRSTKKDAEVSAVIEGVSAELGISCRKVDGEKNFLDLLKGSNRVDIVIAHDDKLQANILAARPEDIEDGYQGLRRLVVVFCGQQGVAGGLKNRINDLGTVKIVILGLRKGYCTVSRREWQSLLSSISGLLVDWPRDDESLQRTLKAGSVAALLCAAPAPSVHDGVFKPLCVWPGKGNLPDLQSVAGAIAQLAAVRAKRSDLTRIPQYQAGLRKLEPLLKELGDVLSRNDVKRARQLIRNLNSVHDREISRFEGGM